MTEDFFDCNWTHLNIWREQNPNSDTTIDKPFCIDKMLELSKKLALNTMFSRIDLYQVGEKVFFGETTLYLASGLSKSVPDTWDYTFGRKLKLYSEGKSSGCL